MASILPSDAPWSAKDVVTLPTSQRHPFVAWRAFKSKSEDTGFSTSSHRCLLAGEQPAEEPEPIQCRRRNSPQRAVSLQAERQREGQGKRVLLRVDRGGRRWSKKKKKKEK